MQELDRWIRNGNARLFFWRYLKTALTLFRCKSRSHITDTVKLHLKTNNIFNDASASNIESFVTSIKDMAQIWVTRVFI